MSVRKSVHIRESDMALLGKVDSVELTRPSGELTRPYGDHVLVFLFGPFFGEWSQTVGTSCALGGAPGQIIAKLLLQYVAHLFNAGALVDSVTCDNSASNRSALHSLGISGDISSLSNSFAHPCDPSRVVHTVIDPPDIFKCIRNKLLKVGKFLVDILAALFDDILLEPADDEVTVATFQPFTTKQGFLEYLGIYVVKTFSTQTCTTCV
ncbi:hypothetical protein HPB51_003444 [Rhipicephalus microplus]|uniref:Transposable element P transposase-like RNase H domain-containing protein n=1 Tax=Rhipicephalus microplus TaxID=6941 RepID=A0A9J6EWF2_RHIMP|nr:hypothetical protein HPB51_003444 [Rhipicephalus microplus]